MQTQQQSKDSLNTTSSSPQSLWQKLNSPEYTKIAGKRLFCYSLASLLVSFVLAVLLRNTFIATFFREVFIYSFLGLPIGGFLWIGKFDDCETSKTNHRVGFSNQNNSSRHLHINDSLNPISYNYRSRH